MKNTMYKLVNKMNKHLKEITILNLVLALVLNLVVFGLSDMGRFLRLSSIVFLGLMAVVGLIEILLMDTVYYINVFENNEITNEYRIKRKYKNENIDSVIEMILRDESDVHKFSIINNVEDLEYIKFYKAYLITEKSRNDLFGTMNEKILIKVKK